MSQKHLISDTRPAKESLVKSRPSTIKRWRKNNADEPDSFRRAIERWTVRGLLIIASIVLAVEMIAWAVLKVRDSTHEIMQDGHARQSKSVTAD